MPEFTTFINETPIRVEYSVDSDRAIIEYVYLTDVHNFNIGPHLNEVELYSLETEAEADLQQLIDDRKTERLVDEAEDD